MTSRGFSFKVGDHVIVSERDVRWPGRIGVIVDMRQDYYGKVTYAPYCRVEVAGNGRWLLADALGYTLTQEIINGASKL